MVFTKKFPKFEMELILYRSLFSNLTVGKHSRRHFHIIFQKKISLLIVNIDLPVMEVFVTLWEGDCTIWMLGLLNTFCCNVAKLLCELTLRIPVVWLVPPVFCCCRNWICCGWVELDVIENCRNCCGWFVVVIIPDRIEQ